MNSGEYLLLLFKRKNKSRRIILSVTSILCTLLIIPTFEIMGNTAYAYFFRILFPFCEIYFAIYSFFQVRSMKKQISDISEYDLDRVSSELESSKNFMNIFYFTNSYLFSTEGLILPYYEITHVTTYTYMVDAGQGVMTDIWFKTRNCGRCMIPTGNTNQGYFDREFYDMLSDCCPSAHLTFKVAWQKANIDDYYLTVKNKSITIIKSKTDSEVK